MAEVNLFTSSSIGSFSTFFIIWSRPDEIGRDLGITGIITDQPCGFVRIKIKLYHEQAGNQALELKFGP